MANGSVNADVRSQRQSVPLQARGTDTFDGAASFSLKHRLYRVGWGVAWNLLASWTPPPMRKWRAAVLRIAGAKIGKGVQVYGSAKIWYPPNLVMEDFSSLGPGVNCYCMDSIHIGRYVVISQGAHLCGGTHDIRTPDFQLKTRPIEFGDNAWICAEAFVGPGVTVGAGAVLGARAVAFRDLEPWTVYSGNPAQAVKARPKFER